MAEPTQLLYLEPDDEITSVVRRLRETDAGRVVLVASGRAKATTSAVALRLLAGVAAEDGREIALVADASGRTLAAEAGIPAFTSVAEANAENAVPAEPPPARRAPIHVVRGEAVAATAPSVAATAPSAPPPPAVAAPGPGDETQAVAVPTPPPAPRRGRPARQPRPRAVGRRPLPRAAAGALIALLLLSGALLAAVAPSASIVIEPATVPVGPVTYALELGAAGSDQGEINGEVQGTATGEFSDPSPAAGTVTFLNWNTVVVEVTRGTVVAAGETQFTTVETIDVPRGRFGLPITPGEASVGVVAVEPGPGGNVAAGAIDTIVTDSVRTFLRGFPDNPNQLVINADPTSGGDDNRQPEVTQADVDAALAQLRADLAAQLADRLAADPARVYAPAEGAEPVIDVPDDLVGRRGEETFALSGRVAYRRAYVERSDVEAAARDRLLGDAGARPQETEIVADSITVELGEVAAAGDRLTVEMTVRAVALPTLDHDAIREQVAGLTGPAARDALAPLGDVSVELWPDWVDRVPQLGWRIEVRIVDGMGDEPAPSGSP